MKPPPTGYAQLGPHWVWARYVLSVVADGDACIVFLSNCPEGIRIPGLTKTEADQRVRDAIEASK